MTRGPEKKKMESQIYNKKEEPISEHTKAHTRAHILEKIRVCAHMCMRIDTIHTRTHAHSWQMVICELDGAVKQACSLLSTSTALYSACLSDGGSLSRCGRHRLLETKSSVLLREAGGNSAVAAAPSPRCLFPHSRTDAGNEGAPMRQTAASGL